MIVACRNAFGVSTAAKSGCAILFFQNGTTFIAMVIVGFSKKIRCQIKDLASKHLIYQLFRLTTTIIGKFGRQKDVSLIGNLRNLFARQITVQRAVLPLRGLNGFKLLVAKKQFSVYFQLFAQKTGLTFVQKVHCIVMNKAL